MSPTRVAVSTVTYKVVMAVTGVLFVLFVAVHMIGNLKVYTGAKHFDEYARWLRTLNRSCRTRACCGRCG